MAEGNRKLSINLTFRALSLYVVAGLRTVTSGALFLEHYLYEQVERPTEPHAARPADRRGIVEVGSLSASNQGSASLSIITVTWLLAIGSLGWVAFTGNAGLVNRFNRLGLRPCHVVRCRPDAAGR